METASVVAWSVWSPVADSDTGALVGTIIASVVPVTTGLVGASATVHSLQNFRQEVSAMRR